MEALVKLVPLTQELLIYLAMDVAIALVLLMIMKWLTGAFRKYSVTEELGVKDNFAFGDQHCRWHAFAVHRLEFCRWTPYRHGL